MIDYIRFTLPNGLRVLFHKDKGSSMAAVNILYNVGSKDEHPEKTGFAHLFEHLMFGGSKNIESYDTPLEFAGGENNAFTNNDYTNYYLTLPKESIELALWLESDRMLQLNFSQTGLDIQRNVVIEEYKQRYINQPYGDVWFLLRELIYTKHPYRWPTIGKEISHIENATLDDVKSFFYNYYSPNNAIMCIAGNFEETEVHNLANKWFGDIPYRERPERLYPMEPEQTEARYKKVTRDVPTELIMHAYPMPGRASKDFYKADALSDILSSGKSSRFYKSLVVEKQIFVEFDAYITSEIDHGLFIFSGKLAKGVSIEQAELALANELNEFLNGSISEYELQKIKNRFVSQNTYSKANLLHKAGQLCFFELLGDISDVNKEDELYSNNSATDIIEFAKFIFQPNKRNTLHYLKN